MGHAELPAFDNDRTVDQNLDLYLRENGFTRETYDAKWVDVSAFGLSMKIPNPVSRKRAVRLHDLHHIVTGFGTDLTGEGEISAWEVGARGLPEVSLYVDSLIIGVLGVGMVLAPSRMKRAYDYGRASTGSLFAEFDRYETLLAMRLGDLRAELKVPLGGIAHEPRRLHAAAPRIAA